MSDITAEAKISQGLASRYFESKEAIFAELFGQMLEKMICPSYYAAEDSSPALRLSGLINCMLSGNEFFGNFELAFRASVEKTSEDCFPHFMRGGSSRRATSPLSRSQT